MRRQHKRCGRTGRADVGDTVRERVIEIERVTGGTRERDFGEQIIARGAHRLSGLLPGAGAGARQPVQERDLVCEQRIRRARRIGADRHGSALATRAPG